MPSANSQGRPTYQQSVCGHLVDLLDLLFLLCRHVLVSTFCWFPLFSHLRAPLMKESKTTVLCRECGTEEAAVFTGCGIVSVQTIAVAMHVVSATP